jgi:hypothetical protein
MVEHCVAAPNRVGELKIASRARQRSSPNERGGRPTPSKLGNPISVLYLRTPASRGFGTMRGLQACQNSTNLRGDFRENPGWLRHRV